MKPTDVTDEILRSFRNIADELIVDAARKTIDELDKELVACAINAVLGDPAPITAERLVANGWGRNGNTYERRVHGGQYIYWDGFGVLIDDIDDGVSELPSVKTIGQLRALEIGLGITQ